MKKILFALLLVGIAFADPYPVNMLPKGFDHQEMIDSTVWVVDTIDNRCKPEKDIVYDNGSITFMDSGIRLHRDRYRRGHMLPTTDYDIVKCDKPDLVTPDTYKLVVRNFVRFKCPENPKFRLYEQYVADVVVKECLLPYKVDWLLFSPKLPGLFMTSRLIELYEKAWYDNLDDSKD